MYTYIGIEDLAANAIIELLENEKNGEVLFSQLNRYGAVVIRILNEKQNDAILILSRERTNSFFNDYSDYFEPFTNGTDDGIRLKEGVTVDDLWGKFRGCISVEVMKAFMDERSLKELGVS